MMEATPHVKWKLPEVLKREGVSIYRLDQELAKRVSRTTLYKWGSEKGPKQIDPEVLGWVLWGLERITGKRYHLQDLVEVETLPVQPGEDPVPEWRSSLRVYELDVESKAWLEAELTEPLPPYDWGPEGEPEGQPVTYSPDRGFLVIEDETA